MANPVAHVLIPMLIVETYRRYISKKPFSKWYVFIAGFFGGMADFDLIFAWFATGGWDLGYHRSLTHTVLIPLAALVAGLAIHFLYSRKMIRYEGWKASYIILFLAAIALASHILLDGFDGFAHWFYPFTWSIELPNLVLNKYRAALFDGILLFAWLLYQEELFNDILRFFRLKK
jgi:hypothetical protein